MIFTQLPIIGAYLIDIEPKVDERGFFSRTVCIDEFKCYGLNANFVQQSISKNSKKGTLRGMHYQIEPYAEEKLVRVTRGEIWDVILDLRPTSSTFQRSFNVQLSGKNWRAIYIPKCVAHGFQTLTDDTEILYQMTVPYHHEAARGVHWRDPGFAIRWPDPEHALISDRDQNHAHFNLGEQSHG